MWELLKHVYCLIKGHKRKVNIFYTKGGVTWAYHRCERCDYPLSVDKDK